MEWTPVVVAIVLLLMATIIITIGVCKHVYAKRAGTIMKRMCLCSKEEREMFSKVLESDSNGFGTDIFHLFDA